MSEQKKDTIDIIDVGGDSIIIPMSATEKLADVVTYNHLVLTMANFEPVDNASQFADGKYSTVIGREVWRTVINDKKPIIPANDMERMTLSSVYKLLQSDFLSGKYPLLSILTGYFGESIETFFSVIQDPTSPKRRAYSWIYEIYDSAASLNAMFSNGNSQARQWLDKTREYQISAENKIDFGLQQQRIDMVKEHGADVVNALLMEDISFDEGENEED